MAGSSSRRPGTRFLLTANGRTVGTLGSGDLESDIARRGWRLTEAGPPTLVTYDARRVEDAEDRDSTCDGVITVLLERLAPPGHPHPLDAPEAVRPPRR